MRHPLDFDIIHLADNEWNNETMQAVAADWFKRFPDCRAVHVYEHGGWSLGFDRRLQTIASANDMAVFPADRNCLGKFTGREQRRPNPVSDYRPGWKAETEKTRLCIVMLDEMRAAA